VAADSTAIGADDVGRRTGGGKDNNFIVSEDSFGFSLL
jgi:hypothetical protein